MSDGRAVAHAIDALRRGWAVAVDDWTVLAIETADERSLAAFDGEGASNILIAGSRAATLKLANQIAAAEQDRPVLVARAPWLGLDAARVLADPSIDLLNPLQGPYHALPLERLDSARGALELARLAGLLPAFFVRPGVAEQSAVSSADVSDYEDAGELRLVTRSRLPVSATEGAEIVAFRGRDASVEHLALVIGQPDGSLPLVRLHSECLTGDVLGSLKCDCGPQLDAALRLIGEAGWGILLYLRQEGRGIGLINKLRAYRLQDQGFDTVDANLRLGFAVDARNFAAAARMLELLGQECVRLLTNNPDKVAALQAAGIAVVERVPHRLPDNPHNARYLATKRDRTGHQL